MQHYELLYIVSATYSQTDLQKIQEKVTALLTKAGASILHHDMWSQRRLAYPIRDAENGFYVLCYFEGESINTTLIKKELELSREILRSMLISHHTFENQFKRFKERHDPQLIAQKKKHMFQKFQRVKEEVKTPSIQEPLIREEAKILPSIAETPAQTTVISEEIPQEESVHKKKRIVENLDETLKEIL